MTSEQQLQKFHTGDVSLTQIWVVLLIGYTTREICFNQLEANWKHYPDLGSDAYQYGISAVFGHTSFLNSRGNQQWLFSLRLSFSFLNNLVKFTTFSLLTNQHSVLMRMSCIFNNWYNVCSFLSYINEITSRSVRKFNCIHKTILEDITKKYT